MHFHSIQLVQHERLFGKNNDIIKIIFSVGSSSRSQFAFKQTLLSQTSSCLVFVQLMHQNERVRSIQAVRITLSHPV